MQPMFFCKVNYQIFLCPVIEYEVKICDARKNREWLIGEYLTS
ncbi:hypothetical protein ES703_85819 [subsurface metagenome]